MKFSLSWLKQHLETEATAKELADKLVTLGVEVEELIEEGAGLDRVVIGRILSKEQHPEVERLGVCMVDVGENEPRQIVCGAPNARAGLTVAVALDGAVLPGEFKIKKSKLRGVTSNGMICAKDELGLGDNPQEGGIWELDTDLASGTDFAQYLGGLDVVFDVSITPNRGDVLSVYGLARDLAASGIGELNCVFSEMDDEHDDHDHDENEDGHEHHHHEHGDDCGCDDDEMEQLLADIPPSDIFAGKIEHEGCRYFSGMLVSGIKNGESPVWLKGYIEQAGLRPINAVADITNYIMLSYGQPLHAYDADKLKGKLRVAHPKGGEKMLGLDGHTHVLEACDIAIMDDSGVIGIAGIVGGESTAVDENTTRVYLEAAHFDKDTIASTGQRLQCNTDARYRFERGVDPMMTDIASIFAADLITDICGGQMCEMEAFGEELPEPRVVDFDPKRVETFGGLALPKEEVKDILQRLQFEVVEEGAIFKVTVPHHFTIMDTDADLVEEVLRLKGFDAVPAVLPAVSEKTMASAKGLKADRIGRRSLVGLGYMEMLNYSFIAEDKAKLFAEGRELLALENPIDAEGMSTMRPSLIPSLLGAVVANVARSEGFMAFGEVGKTFDLYGEALSLAGVMYGKKDRHWQDAGAEVDVFAAKRDVLAICESLGANVDNLQIREGVPSYYHTGRSGQIGLGKNVFGYFGELHPKVAKAYGLKGRVAMFELNLQAFEMFLAKPVKAKPFVPATYQASVKDMAILVASEVKAGDVVQAVKGVDKDLIRAVEVFDVYTGEGVAKGCKSLALSLQLRSDEKTLSEADIQAVLAKAQSVLSDKFNAVLR